MASSLKTLLPKNSLIRWLGASTGFGRRSSTSESAFARKWGVGMKKWWFLATKVLVSGGSENKLRRFFVHRSEKVGHCSKATDFRWFRN